MTHLHTDLGDFQKLAKENDGYRYLLVAVDLLSRRLFTAPVKSKESKDMIDAFKEIFNQMPYLPQEIFSGLLFFAFFSLSYCNLDRGTEFEAKNVKELFEELGIKKYKANSSKIKAAVAERMVLLYLFFNYFLLFRSELSNNGYINILAKKIL